MNEQNKKPQKKELPYACTKGELIAMYVDQIPERTIVDNINLILKANNVRIYVKRIPHNQFMEFVETYGLPKNYYLTDND